MLQKCEDICNEKYKTVKNLAVISGIGAREYYRKQGYELKNEYMVKNIDRI